MRASSPHQDQPLNSTIFLRARPFAFSLGSSKDQGLGNWLQVHDNCISRIKLQVASNLQHRTIDCGKSKPLSMCSSSTKGCLVKCPGFLLSCTSLRFPWRTFVLRIHEMFFGVASRVHSGPIFAVAPAVHQACLANCNASKQLFIAIYICHLDIYYTV